MDRRTVVLLFFAIFTTGAAAKLARGAAKFVPKSAPKPSPSSPRLPDNPSAIYTANLAFQDPAGGTNAVPNYESVHLMADGRIASIGWIGIHSPDFSNAIFAFHPETRAVDLLAPWEQYVSAQNLTPKVPPVRGVGYNKQCGTYDNHPSAYFASTNTLVWFGHCVFDVTTGKYVRGNRPPQTAGWETYATGHDGMWSTYNPAYAQCPALDVVAFYGSSYGGYGTPPAAIVLWKHTGPPEAPWQATVTDLAAKGMPPVARARNNAACLGTKMYVGGGETGQSGSISNSVFTFKGHGYKEGYEFYLTPDNGQSGMPAGMIFGQTYYVRDVTPNTFRIAKTRDGPALTIGHGDKASGAGGGPNYRMWSIDLTDLTVELVSTEWALGVGERYPQLVADTRRKRLVLIGKKVSVFEPMTRTWANVAVQGWPSGGYKSVVGAYVATKDKIYFRGTPISYSTGPEPWQWNSIEFTVSAQQPNGA